MTGVYRQTLNSIQPNTQNSFIIGIIIKSHNSNKFDSARGTRAVWNFTLRDSEEDFINVTVWGSVDFVSKLTTTFHVGSVVEVINAKVITRSEKDDNFRPNVSSSYSLTVNEGAALIQLHDASDSERYERLLRLPTKSPSELRTFASILNEIDDIQGQFVNLLVVVIFVSESRTGISRMGKSYVCRDIEVADGSTQENLSLKLWENEFIRMSEFWEPNKTVLFIADAQVGFDSFKRKTVVQIVRKSLITENPVLPQAEVLRNSIQCQSDYVPHDPFITPNPESIKTVMTIHAISEKLNESSIEDGERLTFVTILYASVTEINTELMNNFSALITRCALCKKIVTDGNDSCMNIDCPCGSGRREPMNVAILRLRVTLKDDTGYLIGCRLAGQPAEKALGCTPSEFAAMDLADRSELKSKLLKKYDVRLQIVGPTVNYPRAIYNILSMKPISEQEDDHSDGYDDRFPDF